MTQTATIAISLLCAAAVSAGGILFVEARRPEPAAPVTKPDSELLGVIEKLEQRLRMLEQRPSTAVQSVDRSAVAVTRADGGAMPEDALGGAASAAESRKATPSDAEFVLAAAYRELLAPGSRARADELWSAARKAGKTKELLALFAAAAKAAPNSSDAQFQHGQACIQALLGTQEIMEQSTLSQLADKSFDAALEIDETHWDARFNKAISYTFWPDFLGKTVHQLDRDLRG